MEDYSPSSDEVEETPLKRRRFLRGNFLRSWLDRRQDSEDQESSIPSIESKEAWRPDRLRYKLRNIFDGLISVETIKVKNTDKQEPAIAETEPNSSAEENGILAVSPDAQLRYYGYELMDEPGLSDEDTEPEIEEDVEIDHSNEDQEVFSRVQTSREQSSSSTEPVGEVLRRRQAKRLEKRVKRLKRETKNLKREQKDVKEQQRFFANQLIENQEAQKRFEHVTVPKMEKARQRLQERLERPLKAVKSEADRPINAEISHNKHLEFKSELKPIANDKFERLNEATKPEPKSKLEELINNLELTPSQEIVSEKSFERRHEVMDPADSIKTVGKGRSTIKTTRLESAPIYPPQIIPTPTAPSTTAKRYQPFSVQPGKSMYQQAAKTGFWSGIALTLIALLVIIFMR